MARIMNLLFQISYADHYAEVAQQYLDVITQQGVPLVEDKMDLKTGHGCQVKPLVSLTGFTANSIY